MARTGKYPVTRTKNPEPDRDTQEWVIWAAWADRVTFDEIRERTGYTEAQVIKLMRKSLKSSSFRLWRKRVSGKSTKHLRRFSTAERFCKSIKSAAGEDF